MKITKITKICAVLLLLVLLLNPAKNVYATPEGWIYGQQAMYVNGQRFDVWGYGYWDGYGNFRLRDIAYVLNGTSAQFNIRQPLGDNLHFWVERGAPYAPIGTELGYLYETQLEWRLLGGFHAYAVEHFPLQQVIFSMDGAETPEVNAVVTVLTAFGFPLHEPGRLACLDRVYFDMEGLAGLLGFGLALGPEGLHITTGAEYVTENREPQPLELLDMLLRLTGHWVDRRFYESTVITQEVAWPHEFEIGLFGVTYQPRFVDFQFSGIPLAARQPNEWQQDRVFHPLTMESFEGGTMVFQVYGLDRKIRAEWNPLPFNTLIYYVDGVPHEMVRLDPNRSPARYHHEALEEGGIRIAYIPDYQTLEANPDYIHIYRSHVQGDEGERILTFAPVDKNDRIFFEFTDPYAKPGTVYFYTVKTQRHPQFLYTVTFGGEPQTVVYTDPVQENETATPNDTPGTTESVTAEPPEHTANTPAEAPGHRTALRVTALIGTLAIIATACLFLSKKIKTNKPRR
jgi:hypothetical protein